MTTQVQECQTSSEHSTPSSGILKLLIDAQIILQARSGESRFEESSLAQANFLLNNTTMYIACAWRKQEVVLVCARLLSSNLLSPDLKITCYSSINICKMGTSSWSLQHWISMVFSVNKAGKDSDDLKGLFNISEKLGNLLTEDACFPDEAVQQISVHAADLIFSEITEKKIRQKGIEKILQDVKRIEPAALEQEIRRCARKHLKADTTTKTLLIWSAILENHVVVRNILEQNEYFCEFLQMLCSSLFLPVAGDVKSPLAQQHLHAAVRLCLQVFQFLPQKVRDCVWGTPIDTTSVSLIGKILHQSFTLLLSKESQRDLKLLIGMAVSLLVTMAPSGQVSSEVFFDIHRKLGSNREIKLGNITIQLHGKAYTGGKERDLDLDFALIALLNGALLSSMNLPLLLSPTPGDTGRTFLTEIFPDVCKLCRSQYVYNGFQLLQLWFQTYHRYNGRSVTSLKIMQPVFSGGGSVASETLDLIWTNWDNPVKGVPEAITKIFTFLLKCHQETKECSGGKDDKLLTLLTEKIMSTPWNSRGKHRLLTSLLEFVDSIELLTKYPDTPSQMAECLSTSFLASISSDVYRSFMEKLRREKESPEEQVVVWSNLWMKDFISVLTSSNQVLRYNASHFWVPLTLKTLPEVLNQLKAHFTMSIDSASGTQRTCYLYAWTAIMKTARSLHLVPSLEVEPLREVLHHSDDDLRSDAFTLLCYSPKKSEPLSPLEFSLLRESILDNLNIDHAPFRMRFLFALKAVLVRLRDNSLSLLKMIQKKKLKNGAEVESIMKNMSFFDWLLKECFKSIFPGASYQRLITVLELIDNFLTAFTYNPSQSTRKAFTPVPETVPKLMKYANVRNMLEFYSTENMLALLHCTMEETVEIQELSCRLLVTYFPWPLHLDHKTDVMTASHILSHALTMCRKPKGQQSASGANLCNLIFRSYAVNLNWRFSLIQGSECPTVQANDQCHKVQGAVHFIHLLADMIKTSIEQAETDVLKAAIQNPGHGYIQAVRLCIASHCEVITEQSESWRPCIERVIQLATTILDNILYLLGGKSESAGLAPSFAQMGTSILMMIQQTQGNEDDGVVLSDEFQHILTWCWISIKECSLLLGNLPGYLCSSATGGLLEFSQVEHIGAMLIKVLTNCRHRGAIEGCNLGFMKFMNSLLSSSDAAWNRLPQQYLEKVLKSLSGAQARSSITRRSAGLPLLVQSITASETKFKQSHLLDFAMKTLLAASSEPYQESDQTVDIPQVHAMNILETLFRDACLSHTCLVYVSDAVQLTISSFVSPSWAIRNAATKLFGSLLLRIFGQKKMGKFAFSSTTTAQEFFAQYPVLQPFLLKQLQDVVCHIQLEGRLLHPTVFPLLAILSRLAPSSHQNLETLEDFKDPVVTLLGNPVYQVRDLASTAVVVFTSDRIGYLKQLIQNLPDSWMALGRSANRLHGELLLIEKLVQVAQESGDLNDDIIKLLYEKEWLTGPGNPCCVVQALYLRILDSVPARNVLISHGSGAVEGVTQPTGVQVGKEQSQRCLAKHFMSSGNPCVLETFLQSGLHEVREECLEQLHKMIGEQQGTVEFWINVESHLFKMVLTETRHTLLQSCLELILLITEKEGYLPAFSDSKVDVQERLCLLYTKPEPTLVSALALAVAALFLWESGKNEDLSSNFEDWSKALLEFSQPVQTETIRLQTAKAMVYGGCSLLKYAQRKSDDSKTNAFVTSVFDAGLLLLQDESSAVRQEVTKMAKNIPQTKASPVYPSLQFNSVLQRFLEFMAEGFAWSEHFIFHVLKRLAGHISTEYWSSQCNSKGISSLFEQEEMNIFAEKVVLNRLLCQMLTKMIKRPCSESLWRHMRDMVEKTLVWNMSKMNEYLCVDVKDKPIFNNLLSTKVYLSLTTSICLSRLLCGSSLECDTGGITTVRELESLTKDLQMTIGHLIIL